MKVTQPDMRSVAFDCPWTGHVADPGFTLRNKLVPNLVGLRCVKCGALVYETVAVASAIVGADGEPLPAQPAPPAQEAPSE